jgi:excisionase family DNA binding protein
MATQTLTETSKVLTSPLQQRQAQELVGAVAASERWAVLESGDGMRAVPPELSALLTSVLRAVADGGVVTIGSMPEELTTTAAAELLGVSRPTLMKIVAAGEVPAHKVGTHTRLRAVDVLELRRARIGRQREAFTQLLALEDAE